jgi:hypothetical protein
LFRGDEHEQMAISASAAISKPVNAKYLFKSIRVDQRDAHMHLNRMLSERDLGQKSAPLDRPLANISIDDSTSVPGRGCERRASATP